MANNREISQFASFLTVDESANNNVGIATTVRISAGGLYVDGVEVIGPGGAWRGPNSGLVGAQGAQGAPGAQGAQGADGAQGNQGYQGRQGTVGAQGTQGAVGAQGTQGAVGAQGTQGAPGAQGAQGTPGSPGAQGAQGAQGRQGASGPTDQIAKAWVNFNGVGSVGIRQDYNVNSISDQGTGQYFVNFSSGLSNGNYAAALGTSMEQGYVMANGVKNAYGRSGTMSSSGFTIWVHNNSNHAGDESVVTAVVFD